MPTWNRKMTHRFSGAAAAVALALSLVACGGNSDDLDNLTVVATADLTAAASPVTASAVVGEPFVFASGVPELSTASSTKVTFTSASDTTPAFKIEATEGTATGTTTFGSCIFTVTASSFPSGHPLALGKVLRVDPCNFVLPLIGVPISTTFTIPALFTLGSRQSGPTTITVFIQPSGAVQVNNSTLGQTSVGGATGATGGGS